MARVRPGKAERAAARAAAAEARIVRSAGHDPSFDDYYCATPIPTNRRPIASGTVVRGGHYSTRTVRATAPINVNAHIGCVTKQQHAKGATGTKSLTTLGLI